MFHSRDPRRRSTKKQRTPFTRRLSRQFSVEAMEGRLMLDGTALDVAPVELQPVPIVTVQSLYDSQVSLGDGDDWTPVEGGNVTLFLSPSFSLDSHYANRADSQSRQELIAIVKAWRQNNGHTYDGVPGISFGELGGDVVASGIDFGTSIFSDADFGEFSTNSIDRGWIRAVNFQDTSGTSSLNSSLGSFELYVAPESRFAMSSGAEEGGPIPIKTIISRSELELVQEVEPAQRAPTVAALQSPELEPETHLAATAAGDAVVSAEWARAMVLETAGGEPDAMAKSPGDKASQKSEILPASHSGGPLSYVTPIRATGPTSTGATDGGGTLVANSAYFEPVAGVGHLHVLMSSGTALRAGNLRYALVSNPGASRADMSFAAERAARAAQLVEASVGMPGALEAAFDELGDSSQPVSESLAADWLSRGLSAAPLLMVLALERVTSRNSRRNRRDNAPITVHRLKLSRRDDNNEKA